MIIMSDCCSDNHNVPSKKKTRPCPVNGNECHEAAARTIKHHIQRAWEWEAGNKTWYFCEDPDCEVVYFADDNSVIRAPQLRTTLGIKTPDDTALICYCFGVTKADVISNPAIRHYVIEQTRNGECSCETSNPSGRCCLKDFPHYHSS